MSEIGDEYREVRLQQKTLRQHREDSFKLNYYPKLLEKGIDIYNGKNGNYIIDSNLGVIDFFSKSNKLLIRESNKWLNDGLKWIKDKLLMP